MDEPSSNNRCIGKGIAVEGIAVRVMWLRMRSNDVPTVDDQGVPVLGTIEHARCSSCGLGLDGPMVVGEMEALVAMNISKIEIILDAEVEE